MSRKFLAFLAIISFLIPFSGCNNAAVESGINLETSISLTEETSDTAEQKFIGQIDYDNKISLSIFATDKVVDVRYMKDETESTVISHTMFADDYIVQKHSENNQEFLIIAEPIIGATYPATIITIVNGEPMILSNLEDFDDNEKYMGLFYCMEGDLICDRGESVSVGATNIIPYYWNSGTNNFHSYELSQISIGELDKLDKDEIVYDKNAIDSIYKRSNGLVHVNYKESDMEYSQTYVFENEKLRLYNFDTDLKYGFFLENFCITPDKNVQQEIFIDNVKHLNNYNENELTINSENAMSNLIDALVMSEKWREEFKLICSGMAALNQEAYYQITLSTENEFSYSSIGVFWVNAASGTIYLKFDPILDAEGYFSEFSNDIPKADGRTRLIAFPAYPSKPAEPTAEEIPLEKPNSFTILCGII